VLRRAPWVYGVATDQNVMAITDMSSEHANALRQALKERRWGGAAL